MLSTTDQRFFSKVRISSECWIWTAGKNNWGYGYFKHNGRVQRAHRVAYEEMVGPIPEGLELDHLCRNRACVRPDHLEAVTRRENVLRGDGLPAWQARQTHCKRGHDFQIGPDGRRRCRVCERDLRRERKKETSLVV